MDECGEDGVEGEKGLALAVDRAVMERASIKKNFFLVLIIYVSFPFSQKV